MSEQCLFGGPQGCAMLIQLTETQQVLFDVKDSLPHVVVTVTPGYELGHLHSMVTKCCVEVSPLNSNITESTFGGWFVHTISR